MAADSFRFTVYTKEQNEIETFEFTVINPAFSGSMRGIKVLQQKVPAKSSVKVR